MPPVRGAAHRISYHRHHERVVAAGSSAKRSSIGFSGSGNQATALSESGKVGTTIHYQMQGNILASDAVIHDAARAFSLPAGKLSDRVMAAMEAADAKGGDKRCTDGRTAFVAYILVVDKSGQETYISATDEESPNPISTLRAKYGRSGL